MSLQLLPIPAFRDNYIWRFAVGDRVWLVDPGDADAALAGLQAQETLAGVLVTHHHPDHIGGLERLHAPGVEIIAADDQRIPLATRRVADGDVVDCDGVQFQVIATPGHTRSHLVYFGAGTLFCGDTLFSLGCGRLFEGSARDMLQSLDRLNALPDDTRVACAHEYTLANARFAMAVEPHNPVLGDYIDRLQREARGTPARPSLPSTLLIERACNPFLRIDVPTVRAAVAEHAAVDPQDRTACFAALRCWKDQFPA